MSISRPKSITSARLAIGAALFGVVLFAAPVAHGDPAVVLAGFDTTQVVLPGLHLKTRDDHTPENGGVTMSFADDNGEVHALVRLAVARDAAGARAFVNGVVRGVSGTLASSTIEDVAFAGDRFIVAARGNVAYVIDALDGSVSASSVAAIVKRAIVAGTPVFPGLKVALPASIDRADPRGAAVTLVASTGTTHHVRATGAYVTHAPAGESVHAYRAGTVEVVVEVVDAMARVTEARASAIAR